MKILKTNLKIILYFLIISIGPSLHAFEKDQQIYLKIENFFKKLKTLEADFIQVGPSGDISNGKIYLDLPSKLRIDYEKPNNLLITSQGFWIVIQDEITVLLIIFPLTAHLFQFYYKTISILNNENLNLNIA